MANSNEQKWLNIMSPHIDRMVSKKIYCKLCGKPIQNYGDNDYGWELKYEVHKPCAARHNAEQERKKRVQKKENDK